MPVRKQGFINFQSQSKLEWNGVKIQYDTIKVVDKIGNYQSYTSLPYAIYHIGLPAYKDPDIKFN